MKLLKLALSVGALVLLVACGMATGSETDPPAAVQTEAPVATNTPAPQIDLPDLGQAPEISNEVWINSDPLTLAELEGSVVLIEFWTYS